MKFVDFGDCGTVHIEDIRLLPTRFQQLPCLAVSVKLEGVSAYHNRNIVKLLVRQKLLNLTLGKLSQLLAMCRTHPVQLYSVS